MKLLLYKKPGSVTGDYYKYVVNIINKITCYVDEFNSNSSKKSDILYIENLVPLKNYYRGVTQVANEVMRKIPNVDTEDNLNNNTVSIKFNDVEIATIELIYEEREKNEKNTV